MTVEENRTPMISPSTAKPCPRNPRHMNHSQTVTVISDVPDLLRDIFKPARYQDVILPLTVLLPLHSMLTPPRDHLSHNNRVPTYVCVLTKRERPRRRVRVQLIHATTFSVPLRKSLTAKPRQAPFAPKPDILPAPAAFRDRATRHVGQAPEVVVTRVHPTTHLPSRKITLERPLRLHFPLTPSGSRLFHYAPAFANRPASPTRGSHTATQPDAPPRAQHPIRASLGRPPDKLPVDRAPPTPSSPAQLHIGTINQRRHRDSLPIG